MIQESYKTDLKFKNDFESLVARHSEFSRLLRKMNIPKEDLYVSIKRLVDCLGTPDGLSIGHGDEGYHFMHQRNRENPKIRRIGDYLDSWSIVVALNGSDLVVLEIDIKSFNECKIRTTRKEIPHWNSDSPQKFWTGSLSLTMKDLLSITSRREAYEEMEKVREALFVAHKLSDLNIESFKELKLVIDPNHKETYWDAKSFSHDYGHAAMKIEFASSRGNDKIGKISTEVVIDDDEDWKESLNRMDRDLATANHFMRGRNLADELGLFEGAYSEHGKLLEVGKIYSFGLGISSERWLITKVGSPKNIMGKICSLAWGKKIVNGKLSTKEQMINGPQHCTKMTDEEVAEEYPHLRGQLLGRELEIAENFLGYEMFVETKKDDALMPKYREWLLRILKSEMDEASILRLMDSSLKAFDKMCYEGNGFLENLIDYLVAECSKKGIDFKKLEKASMEAEKSSAEVTIFQGMFRRPFLKNAVNEEIIQLKKAVRSSVLYKIMKKLQKLGVEFDFHDDKQSFKIPGKSMFKPQAKVSKHGWYQDSNDVYINYPDFPIWIDFKLNGKMEHIQINYQGWLGDLNAWNIIDEMTIEDMKSFYYFMEHGSYEDLKKKDIIPISGNWILNILTLEHFHAFREYMNDHRGDRLANELGIH